MNRRNIGKNRVRRVLEMQSGSAMILALGVLTVTAILSLSLLSVSVPLSEYAGRNTQRNQCRLNAVSVSDVLGRSIEDVGPYDGGPAVYELADCGLPGDTLAEFYCTDNGRILENADVSDPEFLAGYPELILHVKVTSTVGRETFTVTRCYAPVCAADGDGTPEQSGEDDMEGLKEVWIWIAAGAEQEKGEFQ